MLHRLSLAVSVCLCSAAVVSAGPLEWSWSISVSPLSGGDTLFAVDSADPKKGYTLPFPAISTDDPGPIAPVSVPAAASIGVATFKHFSQEGHPSSWVQALAPEDPNSNKFKVTIKATELASGDTGVQDFTGTLSYRTENGEIIPDVSFDRAFANWELGGYKFNVNLTAPFNPEAKWRSVSSEWTISGTGTPFPPIEEEEEEVEVPVEVEVPGEETGGGGVGSPVETPEPGTLVLGGIALTGGVGAWWRKRRKV